MFVCLEILEGIGCNIEELSLRFSYVKGLGYFCQALLPLSYLLICSGISSATMKQDSAQPFLDMGDEAYEHLRLGIEFFLIDELDVAIDEFREASRLSPGYADASHNLGVALAKTGDLTGAIKAWTEAERLDPSVVSLRYSLPALVAYNYGVSLIRLGKPVDAMKEWQAALHIQPYFPEAHYALGLGFLAVKNPAVALGHFQAALSFAPDWGQAHLALGQAHYESHEYDQARTAWLKALVSNPNDARIYANLGHLAIQEGNYQEGIEAVRRAIVFQPDLVAAHFNLGVALLAKGEAQASVDVFSHVLDLDVGSTFARLLMGVAWSRLGNWAEAAHQWRKALQQDPFGSHAFWLHHNLGLALTAMGHFSDATKEFQWVVGQRPAWVEGWSQLGVSLMSERRWGEAVSALKRATQLQPQWAHLHFTLGKALTEQGKLDLAVRAFQEAIRIDPNFVDGLFHLGIVLRTKNQLSEAVEPLRQAAEGGSREAQGLLASMYANGSGIDRNLPLAMLWWSRCSRGAIDDVITRTARNQLAQLRRRLHRQQFSQIEQQDVHTGFALIRQDLASQVPVHLGTSSLEHPFVGNPNVSPTILLRWMIERALALDDEAQDTLRLWFVDGVVDSFPLQQASLQEYWLRVAKEGDRNGCDVLEMTTSQEMFSDVRQACQVMRQEHWREVQQQ